MQHFISLYIYTDPLKVHALEFAKQTAHCAGVTIGTNLDPVDRILFRSDCFKLQRSRLIRSQARIDLKYLELLKENSLEIYFVLRGAVKYYFADFVRKGGGGGPPDSVTPFSPP